MNSASTPKAGVKAIATADWRIIFRRKPLLIILALAFAVGGGWCLWNYLMHPPRPFIVRWQISRYLGKHAAPAIFKVDFPFPSKAEMAKAPSKSSKPALEKGPRTGKDFDSLAHDYIDLKTSALALERGVDETGTTLAELQTHLERHEKELADAQKAGTTTNLSSLQQQVKVLQTRVEATRKRTNNAVALQQKQAALEPILADLTEFQKAWEAEMQSPESTGSKALARGRAQLTSDIQTKLEEATSYATMYQLIGQELYVAKRLLGSSNPEHGRMGLGLALQASHNALNYAQNGWLAARICEGYIWPHLDLANDANRRSTFNLESILNQCGDIFRQNEEANNVVRNYHLLLAFAKTPLLADSARAQLGRFYARNGELKEALACFKQIKSTNDPNFRFVLWQIPQLERQLKGK